MTEARTVRIREIEVSNRLPLTLIAGPCQLEGLDHALAIAEVLAAACARSGAGFIFKSSYDKANRTSLTAQRGIGMDEGLAMLAEVPRADRLPGADRRAPPGPLRPCRASR